MPKIRLKRIGSNWSDTGGLQQKKNKNGSKELVVSFVEPIVA